MAERYYISEYADWTPQHGGIGNHDIELILEREGFKPIRFPSSDSFGFLSKVSRSFHLMRLLASIPSDAVIAFQHPLYARMSGWTIRILNNGKRKLICIVSDIDGLKDDDERLLKQERRQFMRYGNFIVHNPAMREWFRREGITGKFACLDLFDYLTKEQAIPREFSFEIAYAGNLAFRPFVSRLAGLASTCPNLFFHLYGDAGKQQLTSGGNLTYHGSMGSYEICSKLRGSFGLIWEGKSLETLQGGFSEYLKYISPHKLSMYLAAGMPVICHPDMGIAEFVREQGIGLTVSDLHQLEGSLKGVDKELYEKMRANCLALRPGIVQGRHLADAVNALMS